MKRDSTYHALIVGTAIMRGLSPALVMAIVEQESYFMDYLSRYEKGYRWLFEPEEVMPKYSILDTEHMFQKTSWGLMQVMGAVAREYGFTGWVPDILDPVQNLKFGCTHLLTLKSKSNVKSLPDLIAAYNAGSPRRKAGRYVNQPYVDSVLDKIKHWEVTLGIPATF